MNVGGGDTPEITAAVEAEYERQVLERNPGVNRIARVVGRVVGWGIAAAVWAAFMCAAVVIVTLTVHELLRLAVVVWGHT